MTRRLDPFADLSSAVDVLLNDGSVGVVRRLERSDAADLLALHERVGPEALRLRFFAPSTRAAQQYVDHVLSSPETLALVAEDHGRLVAVATAEPVTSSTSEVAFLCDDEHHGLGLGTLLLEHVAAVARDSGIDHLVAEVLADNRAMLGVFGAAGFDVTRRLDQGVVAVDLRTAVTPGLQEAVDSRECAAEARSLAALLRPSSVAVIGVRRDDTGAGAEVVRAVLAGGYQGRLAVIHPTAATVAGAAAYPTCGDVPDGIDLAIVTVPAAACLAALEDAAAGGARAVVVVSSGFAEVGVAGAAMQRELAQAARRLGVRLVGPNCLGVVGNDPLVRLDATVGTGIPPVGGLAVASQSGGVGIALVDRARSVGLGLSCFVSLGNKADVSGNDLIAAWYDDPGVTVAALYLESFGNPRKFARLARRFAERKPLLAVVGGRSPGGRRAGASHTAAAASAAVGVDALFAQSGVIACDDVDDLVDVARLLAEQPLPRGPRLAVLSNAGGLGVLAADLADELGLEVPELSAGVQTRLREVVPSAAGVSNPLDVGAGARAVDVASLTEVVLESGEVDAILVVLVATAIADGQAAVAALSEVRRQHPDTPLVLVGAGALQPSPDSTLTSYGTARSALRALARAVTYRHWRDVPVTHALGSTDAPALRQHARGLLVGAHTDDGWFSGREARRLLEPAGIVLSGEDVFSAGAAVAAADRIGYPVVLKCDDARVIHRSERGLVHLDLTGPGAVRTAAAQVLDEVGEGTGLLVQAQARGVEIALGIAHDPGLGPLVMIAAGGVATEVWADRVFLVPPIGPEDAVRAVRALRVWPLLAGFRGAPRGDVVELERLVLAVGRLADHVPEVAELDLNPVLVGPLGCSVVDVALRLATPLEGVPVDLPGVRTLRSVR